MMEVTHRRQARLPSVRFEDNHPATPEKLLDKPKPNTQADDEEQKFLLVVLSLLVFFRIVNALLIQTTFAPDEVWQSMEVAHRWVFGYGGYTWEWWPSIAIRSPLHPLLLAAFYKLFALLGMDSRLVIFYTPRFIHGLLAGVTDFNLYMLALRLTDSRSASWILFSQLMNWFTAFTGPRSLVNSLEWTLTTVGFNLYPWAGESTAAFRGSQVCHRTKWFILAVSVCVIIRPTAAILWVPVCLHHLYNTWKQSTSQFLSMFVSYLSIAVPCLVTSIVVDRLIFGRWTVNQLNFAWFNLLAGGGEFYGKHPWHWYFTQGLPSMLVSQLPVALIGWLLDVVPRPRGYHWLHAYRELALPQKMRGERDTGLFFGAVILWTLAAYSCLGHKEFRFIFPILPLILYYTGRGFLHLSTALLPRGGVSHFICSGHELLVGFVITIQVLMTFYTCHLHQRGTNDFMLALGRRGDALQWASIPSTENNQLTSVDRQVEMGYVRALVLMPCHSTPHLSYVHRNISLRLLDCDPDLSTWLGTDPSVYRDEAEVFYEDPAAWLKAEFPPNKSSTNPHFIAMFSNLLGGPGVQDFLQANRYTQCSKFFHTHYPVGARHSRFILVFCATGWILE